jgi:formylglycine-generating enzyme
MIRSIHLEDFKMKKVFILVALFALLGLSGIARAITIETVTVSDAGNTADTTGYGSVGYCYLIGKYEVTAGQYTAFLNAVAATDTYGLYNTFMWKDASYGCKITRSGASGSFSYVVASDWANRPVNYVSWGDSARFANWLHNGQPTGAQDLTTTEDGAYFLNGATTNAQLLAVNREADWKWAVTSEDEWYKAAYYDPNKGGTGIGRYWLYPTRSDTTPSNVGSDGYTDPGNHANYYYSHIYTIGNPYYRTNIGEFENSASAYGTFDQGGNVWEWNEAIINDASRGLRGGSFDGNEGFSLLSSSRSNEYTPGGEYYRVGFRVANIEQVPLIFTLSGTVNLLNFGGVITPVPLTIELNGTSYSLNIDSDGKFTISNVFDGTYSVKIKASHWLAKKILGVNVAGNTIMDPVSLTNGDVVDNNEVDFSDINAVRDAYGSFPGDETWNERADVDGSGEVDFTDINIVRSNYGEIGE